MACDAVLVTTLLLLLLLLLTLLFVVGTQSPITAQFHHLLEMIETTAQASGFPNKLRVWLDFGPAFNYFLQHPQHLTHPPKFEHDR